MRISGLKRRIMLAAAVAMTLFSNANATNAFATNVNVVVNEEDNENLNNRKNKDKDKPDEKENNGKLNKKYVPYSKVSFNMPWRRKVISNSVDKSFTIMKSAEYGVMTGAAAAMGDESQYTLTQVTQDLKNNPNVIESVENGEVRYYEIGFKQASYGEGPDTKYFKWAEGAKLVETDDASQSVLTINYTQGADVEKIFVDIGAYKDSVGGYYIGADIKNLIDSNGAIGTVDADFIGNTINIGATDSYNYSAVMTEADGKIGKVNSSFIANTINADTIRDTYGTLVKALGQIDEIQSEFIGNQVTSLGKIYGGFVQVPLTGKVGTIQSDFINNNVTTGIANISGVVLHSASSQNAAVGIIENSTFSGNSGISDAGSLYGTLYNSGRITNGIRNTVFANNRLVTNSGDAVGGALYNIGVTELTDVDFVNNYAKTQSGMARAGAIYTNTDLTMNVSSGKTSNISGNYILNGGIKQDQAIYMDNGLGTLRFNVADGAKLILGDDIDGEQGYKTIISGSGTVDLFGDILNSNVSVMPSNSLKINMANNQVKTYNMMSLTASDGVKLALDVNFAQSAADKINAGSSSGTILIDSINLIGTLPTTSKKIQIINGGNASIKLAQSVIDAYTTSIGGAITSKDDVIKTTSTWDDKYYKRTFQDITSTTIQTASTNTGKTDSIEYLTSTTNQQIDATLLGDTLGLMNNKSGSRAFNAVSADQVYNVTEDLGTMASGTFSIWGLSDTASGLNSTINGGEYKLFDVPNDSRLNLYEVSIATDSTEDGAILTNKGTVMLSADRAGKTMTYTSPTGSTGILNYGTITTDGHSGASYWVFDTNIKGSGSIVIEANRTLKFLEGVSVEQGAFNTNHVGAYAIFEKDATLKADSITNKGRIYIYADGILSDINNAASNSQIFLSNGTLNKKITGSGLVNIQEGNSVEVFHDSENPENSGLIDAVYVNNPRLYFYNNSTLSANADDLKAIMAVASGVTPSTVNLNLLGGRLTKNINNAIKVNILEDTVYGNEMSNAGIRAITNIGEGKTLTIEDQAKIHRSATINNDGTLNILDTSVTSWDADKFSAIKGSGTTNIYGRAVMPLAGSLVQDKVYVAPEGDLRMYASTPIVNELVNDGRIIFGGTATMTANHVKSGEITGDGLTYVNDGTTTLNEVKISQDIFIKSGARITTPVENINGDVENNGTLWLNSATAGELHNSITGTGQLWVYQNVINNGFIGNDYAMTPKTLTTNADLIGGKYIDVGGIHGGTLLLTGGTLNENSDVVTTLGSTTIQAGATVTSNASIANQLNVNSGSKFYMNNQQTGKSTIAINADMYINADNIVGIPTVSTSKVDGVDNYGNLHLTGGTIGQTISGGGNVFIEGEVTSDVHRVAPRVTVTNGGVFTVNEGGNLTNNYLYNDGTIYYNGGLSKVIQGVDGVTILNDDMILGGNAQIDGTLRLNNGHLYGGGTNKAWNIGKVLESGNLSFDLVLGTSNATHFNLKDGSNATFDITNGINVDGQEGLLPKDADETGLAVGTTGVAQVLFGDSTNSKLVKTDSPDGINSWDFEQHRWKDWTDEPSADVYYDDFIGHRHKDGWTRGIIEVDTTVNPNDSVRWTVTQNFWEPETVNNGDLLHLWNIHNPLGAEKFFRFRAADNVYKSQEDVGTAYAANMNVLGVSAGINNYVPNTPNYGKAQKSIIDLDNHVGFNLASGRTFNIKDVELKNAGTYYIAASGIKSGAITENNGAYEVTGGVENVDFGGIAYSGEGTANVNYIPVKFVNSNVSQITNSSFSDMSGVYNSTDTIYANPTMQLHALYLEKSNLGQKFTDTEGNVTHVGGIYGSKFNNNSVEPGNLQSKTYNGLGLYATGGYIANIVDSDFSGNRAVMNDGDGNKVYGLGAYITSATVGNIDNVRFKDNLTNAKSTDGLGLGLYLLSTKVDKISNSLFENNVLLDPTTDGGGSLYIHRNSAIGEIVNTKFIGNHAYIAGGFVTAGNSTLEKITDSIFENNAAVYGGGAVYVGTSSGNVGEITGDYRVSVTDTEGNTTGQTPASGVYSTSYTTQDGTKYDISSTSYFKNNRVENHVANSTGGGALFVGKTLGTIDGIIFENNSSDIQGGAISSVGNIGKITNSAFIGNNSVGNGGAIILSRIDGTPFELTDSLFFDNHVVNQTATGTTVGGAFYTAGVPVAKIDNVIFENNSVTSLAGSAYGGALSKYNNRGSRIDDITNSKFINNTVNALNRAGGGALYSYGQTIDKIDNVEFINNKAISSESWASGAAIRLESGNINSITNSKFIDNSSYDVATASGASGAGISIEKGKINLIKDSLFKGNHTESTNCRSASGVLYAGGGSEIGEIDNVVFEGNYAISHVTNTYYPFGGAIGINGATTIDVIKNSTFKGNYITGDAKQGTAGGAIAVIAANTSIGEISNTLFDGNYVEFTGEVAANNAYAVGGAICSELVTNTIPNGIINSRFINNYAKSTLNNALGGAISWRGALSLIAKDSGLTEFSGNYTLNNGVRKAEAIRMGLVSEKPDTLTLTLDANTGGHILFNDIINGIRGYDVILTGDETGKISIYNDIENADVISNTKVNIDTADGVIHDYRFKTLTSSDDAKYTIDVDFANVKADNFTLDELSSGIMYLDNLNILSNNDKRVKVQVLKTLDDGIKLGINGENISLETDIIETLGDTVYDDADYSEKAGYALSTTDTKHDSITQLVDHKHDALKLITSSENNEDRSFVFNTDNEYKVFEDLEKAYKGNINLKGRSDGVASVINADSHKMFELGADTVLNIENVALTGSDKPITMTANAAVNTSGTSEIHGAILGGVVNILDGSLKIDNNTLAQVNKTTIDGTLTVSNDSVENIQAKVIEAKENAKLVLDMDLTAQSADKIISTAGSNGIITVSKINYLNGDENVSDFTVQILENSTNNNALKLALDENLNEYKIKDISRIEQDEVQDVTNFNEAYYNRRRNGELYGDLSLATTSTTNDSIKLALAEEWETSTVQLDKLGDTLAIVNQSDRDDRTLLSNQSTDLYILSDELGEMGDGRFTITGVVEGDERSTINLVDYDGFVVGKDTEFNVVDTRITGLTDDIIKVTEEGSVVNLSGANIDGNIVGEEKFDLNISGTNQTIITGQVKNANVTFTQGELQFSQGTFADEDTTVNIKGGNVALDNGTIDDYEFNNLNADSEATFSIDISLDKDNAVSDTITAHQGSGLITLERFNIFGNLDDVTYDDTYKVQILKASNDNLQLTFSETVMSQLHKEQDLGTKEELTGYDEVRPTMNWKDELREYYTTFHIKGKLALATTDTYNDSINLEKIRFVEGARTEKLGDTLKILSQANLDEDRNFNFDSANDTYILKDNIGTTSDGKLSINGFADGDNLSKIDMGKYSGWGLSDDTELTVNNVEFVNTDWRDGGLINVSNSDAVVNLNNVKIKETVSTNAISNAGTVNMTGGVVELDTGIVGVGVTNVEGADVILGETVGIVQAELNVNRGSLVLGDRGYIKGNLSVGEQGVATVGVGSINNAVKNDGNLIFKHDGTLLQNVSGQGTTHITSNIINGAKIDQDVDIQNGAYLKSHTNKLGGKINNDGDLDLKGKISDVITGSGVTTVDETLDLFAGAGIDGTLDLNGGKLSTQDNTTSDYNINKLVGEGTFSLDVAGGAAPKADKFVLTDTDSQGKINIADLKFLNSDDITEDFKVQIVDTNGNSAVSVALSEELKSVDIKLGRISRPEYDEVNRITKYSDIYNKYTRGGNLYGNLVEATTDTLNDSIAVKIDHSKTKWDDNRTIDAPMGDTLALWNTLDTDEVKQFVFDRVATYKVDDSVTTIGETKGKDVSIVGFSNGENKATIDFNGKGGFVLKENTQFKISDMKLTGTQTVVDVQNTNAKVQIKDSIIDGDVNGSAKFDVNINGQNLTTLNGVFKNADTVLEDGSLRFKTNTFADASDTLKTIGGRVLLNDSSFDEYEINVLTSNTNAKYNIDINLRDKLTDTIKVNTGSGKVLLDELNIIAKAQDVNKDYKLQILKVSSDDLQLALSANAEDQIKDPEYLLGTETINTREKVKPVTNWQHDYKKTTKDVNTYGRMNLATTDTTNDSIGIKITDVRDGDIITSSQGDVLMVVNKSADEPNKTFEFDTSKDVYNLTDNLGETSGKVIVEGVTDKDGKTSTIDFNKHSGFEVPDGADVELNNLTLTGALADEGAVIKAQGTDADISLKNINIKGNTVTGEHGAAIYSNSDVDITTDNFVSSIEGNKTSVNNEAIYLGGNAKLTLNTVNNGVLNLKDNINGESGYSVHLTGDETANVNLTSQIENAKVQMDNITLNLSDNNHFTSSDLTINSGTLNLVNDKVQEQIAKNININGSFKLNADVDLAKISMDKLPSNTVVTNSKAMLHVDKLNLLSDTTAKSIAIPFAYKGFKGNVDYIGAKELSKDTQVTTAYAPIYKYNIHYENRSDMGYFVFSRGGGSTPDNYNPAILTTPVSSQAGMHSAMNQAFLYAFEHGEAFMNYSIMDRFAKANSNTYALSTDFNNNGQSLGVPHHNKSVWVKPFATFETISLQNGPKVDTINYGTLIGVDSDIKRLKRGWLNVGTVYAAYIGSQIKHQGVDTSLNGGLLGVTETFYKGNLWTAVTATAGAGVADAHTMYGKDDIVSIMAGIASKTGYNFEFADGKFIVQPRLMMSYSMINAFDYTNAAGVRINSDPMHTIQLNPAIKLVGNVRGWQPYASVGMVWNLMNKTHTKANGVVLPSMHTKPYVEYGVGIQRVWEDKFSAYGQAMVRNGGRTGIALTFGFRWALGHGGEEVVKNGSNRIKNASAKSVSGKKVLKQLNSTRTSKVGNFKKI